MNELPLIQKIDIGSMNFKGKGNGNNLPLLYLFTFFVGLLFLILGVRLFQLTIVKGNYYRRLADENRIRSIVVEAQRGTVLDRKGLVLASSLKADPKKNDKRITSKRVYHDSLAIAPLVGYIQSADSSDFKNDPCLAKVQLGDKVGKKGVEKVFECDLRGVAGKKLIEVDAHGKNLRTLSVIEPQEGKIINLALDLELQKKAAELLKEKKGAVITTKPNGEILVLYSSPSFNPQDFENNNQDKIKEYLGSQDKPLFNRATEGTYPPGSIFKLVLATAALEDKKIDEHYIFNDPGIIKAGPLTFGNWYFLQYGKTEGEVDIVKGIRRSTDTFFYKVGELTGEQRIKYWAQKLGFGKKVDLAFPQAEGLVPSPFWKKETLNENWYLGDTYNFSIGQGYLLVTPLQVNQVTAVFANGGKLCSPLLLKDDHPKCQNLEISKKTLDLIREGMKGACSTGGTGWPLFDFQVSGKKIQTACKTGTAESNSKDEIPHAWITDFAPYDKPEIVVTVLVEESGQGSDIAGPIAKEILKTYFERKK